MNYEAVLDLQGAVRSALAARLTGAKVRIGSAQPREAPARMLYTQAVPPHGTHVIEHAFSLASAVTGKSLGYVDAPFPIDPAKEAWAEKLHASHGGKPIAIVNPGAGWGAKCWPSESYGAVASALAGRAMTVLINHGPGEEHLAGSVRDASGGVAIPLKCSVGELIAITRRASLFIGGDTGPMHLAAALRVPVVALFGPTRPERNGPFGTRSVVLRNPASIHTTRHTAEPDEGLLAIQPKAVILAAENLLEGGDA
jgi:heptosyltransferase-1